MNANTVKIMYGHLIEPLKFRKNDYNHETFLTIFYLVAIHII